ncbi:hypothetical protein VP5_056 [Vibrio virus VPMCC5]|nr:hypothetical protein VP5_056 [Vibrio virus VPMCC5]
MLAGIVSFISIMATVWYAAIAVNNLTHEIAQANTNITNIEKMVISSKEENEKMFRIVLNNQREVGYLKNATPAVLDVNDKYVLMGMSEGGRFKLAIYDEN